MHTQRIVITATFLLTINVVAAIDYVKLSLEGGVVVVGRAELLPVPLGTTLRLLSQDVCAWTNGVSNIKSITEIHDMMKGLFVPNIHRDHMNTKFLIAKWTRDPEAFDFTKHSSELWDSWSELLPGSKMSRVGEVLEIHVLNTRIVSCSLSYVADNTNVGVYVDKNKIYLIGPQNKLLWDKFNSVSTKFEDCQFVKICNNWEKDYNYILKVMNHNLNGSHVRLFITTSVKSAFDDIRSWEIAHTQILETNNSYTILRCKLAQKKEVMIRYTLSSERGSLTTFKGPVIHHDYKKRKTSKNEKVDISTYTEGMKIDIGSLKPDNKQLATGGEGGEHRKRYLGNRELQNGESGSGGQGKQRRGENRATKPVPEDPYDWTTVTVESVVSIGECVSSRALNYN